MGLNSVSSIALSGMTAAVQRLGASAHNVANLATEGFHRLEAQPSTQGDGGVIVNLSAASQPGSDLARDMVDQREALYSFKANLKVFKAEAEMLGALLDASA